MSNEDLLRQYLPASYRDSPIVKLLCAAWGVELDAWDATAEATVQQFCVATAPEEGILKWEQELALTPPAGATLELRRALVQAKLMRPPIMTPEQIQAICNCFVPDKDARVVDPVAPYTFRIVLPSQVPWIDELRNAVSEAKPAHLALEVQLQRSATCNLYAGAVALKGGVQTAKIARPNMTPEGSLLAGFIASLSGVSKISTHMPREAQERKSLGLGVAKGGVRSIQYNPADLPVHERITEVYVGWPTALLVQKAANIQIHPTRPHEAAVGFSFGAVTARHGFVSIRAAPPTKATFGFFAAAAIARGGIHTIKEVTL